jgi:hypothetical protein
MGIESLFLCCPAHSLISVLTELSVLCISRRGRIW